MRTYTVEVRRISRAYFGLTAETDDEALRKAHEQLENDTLECTPYEDGMLIYDDTSDPDIEIGEIFEGNEDPTKNVRIISPDPVVHAFGLQRKAIESIVAARIHLANFSENIRENDIEEYGPNPYRSQIDKVLTELANLQSELEPELA
ncbi:MAG: hypothetical protein ACHQ6U_10890 [Thermodesulfobacteriota bacterium]